MPTSCVSFRNVKKHAVFADNRRSKRRQSHRYLIARVAIFAGRIIPPNTVPQAQAHLTSRREQLDDVPWRRLQSIFFLYTTAIGPDNLDYPRHSHIDVRTPTKTFACPHVDFVGRLPV